MSNAIVDIVNEPTGKKYAELLSYALSLCDQFQLVVRSDFKFDYYCNVVIKDLEKFLVKKEKTNTWPGTELMGDFAIVYKFDFSEESIRTLLKYSGSLYGWAHPNLPEDLCLFKFSGEPWLVSISHERDGYFNISDESEVTDLVLFLDAQPRCS